MTCTRPTIDIRTLTLCLNSALGRFSDSIRNLPDFKHHIADETRMQLAYGIAECLTHLVHISYLCRISIPDLLPENGSELAMVSPTIERIEKISTLKIQLVNGHLILLSMLQRHQDIGVLYAVTSPSKPNGVDFKVFVNFFRSGEHYYAVHPVSTTAPHVLVKIDFDWFKAKYFISYMDDVPSTTEECNFHPVPYDVLMSIVSGNTDNKDSLLRAGFPRKYALKIDTFIRESTSRPRQVEPPPNPYQTKLAITQKNIDNNITAVTKELEETMNKKGILFLSGIKTPYLKP